jgi:putative aminopeptidase FrvX
MKDNKEFLKDYLNAYSPVAQESEGQKIWIDYIRPMVDTVNMDAYGTAYGYFRGYQPDLSYRLGKPYSVVIEAHCDEIAWIVTNIEKEGFLRVKPHGGSDNMIAPSMSVIVHTHDGTKIPGVFGSPAIHVREKRTEMGSEVHDLWIDLGVDSDEKVKELGVEVGCVVTFDTQYSMLGDYHVGRSLDNKIGGYIIAEVVRYIKENDIRLPYDLYVVNSVQEEVGLYGAKMIAKKLQSDIAIVHDVCHNTNHPKMNKSKDGDIKGGKGPCLEYTAQNHRGIIKLIRQVAGEYDIPYQNTVGSYGNDTMAFFLENTPTTIISTPLKYMHTTVEMVHKDDVDNAIKLFIETLKRITPHWMDSINNPTV